VHRRAWLLALVAAGCHVRSQVTTTRPGPDSPVALPGGTPRALPATVELTPDGHLRFVQPLLCPADIYVTVEKTETIHRDPNLATVVVGIVVAVAGAVIAVNGLGKSNPGEEALGGAGVVLGAPFAIAPWIGNGDRDRTLPDERVRKGSGEVDCGTRPVAAKRAKVTSGRFVAYGAVDSDGVFEVSPFTWVDAFDPASQPALDLTIELDGEQTISAVLEASAFAGKRDPFFTGLGIDASVETLQKVPGLEPGTLRVTSRTIDGRPYLRLVLPLANRGPGDAWQVRGVISSDDPEVDGRVMYIGHLAKGESVTGELLIPLSSTMSGELELSMDLREAHGAGPQTPVTYEGRVLEDVPK
jgi:hypothetical protein